MRHVGMRAAAESIGTPMCRVDRPGRVVKLRHEQASNDAET